MTRQSLILAVLKTVRHFFPRLQERLDELPDRRSPKRIRYPARVLVWEAILLFIFQLPARRRLRFDLNGEGGLANLNRIADTHLDHLPHDGTLAYLLKGMPVGGLDGLRVELARALLRKRSLERFRLLDKFYLVAIDGTWLMTFPERHCDVCLHQKRSDGSVLYYHAALEAKLVCPNGLAISVATEFLRNTDGETKQDCELKAFYRLLPRLRKRFPQLSICLLMDSLYLNQHVMGLCRRHHCAYIITFKEGSLPTAYGEFEALHALVPDQVHEAKDGDTRRRYRWVNGLNHEGHRFAAFECVETRPGEEPTRFLWATRFEVARSNVEALSEKGGRCRWKIENQGFNMQKRGGYELEHVYCEDWNAARNFYFALQIAHLIRQLIEKGSLLKASAQALFGSLRAFGARLLEAWRTTLLHEDVVERALAQRVQIRLDSS
jgi:hypothetical protein